MGLPRSQMLFTPLTSPYLSSFRQRSATYCICHTGPQTRLAGDKTHCETMLY